MKKFLSILFCCVAVVASAQTIDSKTNGEYYFTVSPNGRYYAGAIDASYAHFYDAEEKKSFDIEPEDMRGYKVAAINNQGQVAGAYELQAAIWEQGEEWLILPLPEDATEDEKLWYEATGISDGGKFVVGYLGEWATRIVLWTLQDDGIYTVEVLPKPAKDPIYNAMPQLVQPRNISDDGSRILVRWVIDDGHVEFPLVYSLQEDGAWIYNFIDPDLVVKDGYELPEYPNVEGLDFDVADSLLQDYVNKLNAAEAGYYPRLNGASMSSNGKYIASKIGYQGPEDLYGVFYGAVYDIDNDTTIIFDGVRDASCTSVDNKGNASLCTPSTEYFRWSFIANVADPKTVKTLTEWTKERTDGKIDLAEHMMYVINEKGEKDLAEGTTFLASEGTAYMTYQTDLMGTGLTETFFVRSLLESDNEMILDNVQLVTYPNPTTGVVFVSESLSDVVVYDVVGHKVYAQSVVENYIDLSHLVAGNYYIVANQAGNQVVANIIISK